MPFHDLDGDHPMEGPCPAAQGGGTQLSGRQAGAAEAAGIGTASAIVAGAESVRCTPEEDAKMQAAGQLAGSAAHDFNNIFTAVLGNLQLIQRRTDGEPRLREMVAAGIEASLRGKDLANRLLAFSQRRQPEFCVVDANARLTDMEKTLRRAVGRKIDIRTRLTDGLWKIETDPGLLEAAVINLAINAREAMNGGGTVVIETANIASGEAAAWRPSPGAGPYVRISVSDSGCGVAPDLLGRIFEPFFTTKPPRSHAGLGLSMVSAFVEQTRGRLTVDSAAGKGASFNMFLPAAACSPAERRGRDGRGPPEIA